MESMNKFKVLTIVVICLFVFAIGAIYSNTKDATAGKLQQKNESVSENSQENTETTAAETAENSNNTQSIQNLTDEIDNLNRRIDELSQKVNENSSSSLKCKIIGSMGNNGIEQLTEEAALQEASVNNRDIVITCSL